VRGEGEEQVGLKTYETFLSDVCEPLLEMDRSGGLRKDEKGRIVIVFYVTRKEVGEQDAEIKEALARSQVTNAEEQQTRREDRCVVSQPLTHNGTKD
jgi:Ser-tRNA(Ala) deacylase AlaX